MKPISTTAIAAIFAASIGLAAVAPAMAQMEAPPEIAEAGPGGMPMGPRGGEGPGRHRGPGDFFSFERGAEGIEIALVRLSHRLDLTAEQQTLLETLKTQALAAAETFESATEGLRPTAPDGEEAAMRPTIAERLENRIALDKARLAALEAIQPAAAAFFGSLTDEQNTQLLPPQGEREGGPGKREGWREHGQGRMPANG